MTEDENRDGWIVGEEFIPARLVHEAIEKRWLLRAFTMALVVSFWGLVAGLVSK